MEGPPWTCPGLSVCNMHPPLTHTLALGGQMSPLLFCTSGVKAPCSRACGESVAHSGPVPGSANQRHSQALRNPTLLAPPQPVWCLTGAWLTGTCGAWGQCHLGPGLWDKEDTEGKFPRDSVRGSLGPKELIRLCLAPGAERCVFTGAKESHRLSKGSQC